jgi:hypothetical protein
MRKFGYTLTRILANPDIKPLAKIVLRNELEREIKRSKGGNLKGNIPWNKGAKNVKRKTYI